MRPFSVGALNDVERVLDHVKVAQPEEIHLQQADLLYRLHRELRDDLIDAVAVVVGCARVGELDRNDLGQWAIGDYNGGGVDRGVSYDTL